MDIKRIQNPRDADIIEIISHSQALLCAPTLRSQMDEEGSEECLLVVQA